MQNVNFHMVFRKIILICLVIIPRAGFALDAYEFEDPEQNKRFAEVTRELRCPKCQNQNVADSNAPIAKDIRNRVYVMIRENKNKQEIVDYVVDRYGNFATYRPPVTSKTIILWALPASILLFVIFAMVLFFRKNSNHLQVSDQPLSIIEQEKLLTLMQDSSAIKRNSDS
ncbi:MAG: cytochrome c-type biogenesis protein [Pseudomonadota bacterium]